MGITAEKLCKTTTWKCKIRLIITYENKERLLKIAEIIKGNGTIYF